jgi:hypothetical protein
MTAHGVGRKIHARKPCVQCNPFISGVYGKLVEWLLKRNGLVGVAKAEWNTPTIQAHIQIASSEVRIRVAPIAKSIGRIQNLRKRYTTIYFYGFFFADVL